MVEDESTQGNDALAGAPAAPISDWGNVRGFQVLEPAGSDADASATHSDEYAQELGKELGVRAARFSQSVDDSIVLASDGVIRWLGDPVARLIAGEELLQPRAVLLADEALAPEARAAVQTRLELWLSAHIGKVLGPLVALAEPGAVAESVRAIASRISQSLGVLERERVRQQVKTLDQSARSALRKLGVRFGSLYIFVPALLKPGARTLCSQLWGLRRGEVGAERLLAFAAAGRTSFAAEGPLAADTYRVAGFRLCGERVVRIDIVERLNDLIRAAIPDHMRPGGPPASEASGFVVSPQMTSLTGCAGESFASILRSLGYESHRVKKSDFEAATRKPMAPTTPVGALVVEEASLADPSHVESAVADAAVENAHEPDVAEESAPLASEVEASAVEASAFEVVDPEPPAEPESEPVYAAPTEDVETIEAAEARAEPETSEPSATETRAEAPVDEQQSAVVEDAASSPAEEEWIEVWRPAPRRRPQPAPRAAPTAPLAENEAAPPRQAREPRRRWTRDEPRRPEPSPQIAAEAASSTIVEAAATVPSTSDGPREVRRHQGGSPHRQERGRGRPHNGPPRVEEARTPEPARGGKDTSNIPVRKEHRAPPVDMDSPFAKLLALKPLLERRDKRT